MRGRGGPTAAPDPDAAPDPAAVSVSAVSVSAADPAAGVVPAADPRPADPLFDASGGRLALRTGLKYVKEMSAEAMHRIVAARGDLPRDILGRPAGEPDPDGRPYTSFADFVTRARVSIEIAGNLARVGAFDALGTRREELLAQLPILYAGVRHSRAQGLAPAGEQGEPLRLIPDNADIPPLDFLPSWTLEERVRAELEILGLNVSVHPLHFLKTELSALGVTPFERLPRLRHGSRIRLAGVLERAQMPWIRSGHRTLFLTLEDETELAQVVVFNDVYLEFGDILKSAVYLLVEGELQNDEEHGLAVVAKRVYDLLEVVRSGQGTPPAHRLTLPKVTPQTRPGRTG
jgi:DNA polymerase III alpha subunit